MRKAVIILPTFNEDGNVEKVIQGIFEQQEKVPNWELSVVVVDSKSSDGTGASVKKLIKDHKNLHLLTVEKEGLGRAYVQGFEYAFEKLNPFVVFEMDADTSHDPKELPNFLSRIEKGADFVIGSRYMKGGSIPKNWGLDRKILSFVANLVIRLGFMKPNITDWTNGYRAVKSWIVKQSLPHIRPYTGYVFQMALLDDAIKHQAIIEQIPCNFGERKNGVSKINAPHYVFTILIYILLNSSFIKFVMVGFFGFVIDFGLFFLFTSRFRIVPWLATGLSAEVAIMSNFLLNNFWSFAHKKIEGGPIPMVFNFLKFNFVSLGSILIQVIGITLAIHFFGTHYLYVYKVFIIAFLVIPYSYFFYNKVIWKKK